MVLECCICGNITDWKDIKKWYRRDNDFYCPSCIDISISECPLCYNAHSAGKCPKCNKIS